MTECNSVAVGIAGQDYLDRPTVWYITHYSFPRTEHRL